MVQLPNYLPLLDDNVMVCGIAQILKKSHEKSGLSCRQAGELLGLSRDYYGKHLTRKGICSMKFLKGFQKCIDQTIFDKIYAIAGIEFTARKKRLILPKNISCELAYFVGYLQGDGCLTTDNKAVLFADEYFEQMIKMNNLSNALFGYAGSIYPKITAISTKPFYVLEIKSVVLNSFFHSVFGMNRGIKRNLRIPGLIKRDKELLRNYLPGLFDSDGTLPKNPDKAKQLFIDITFKEKEFIQEIKDSLLTFGIQTLKIFERVAKAPTGNFISHTHELRIRQKGMLLKFLLEIGFKHPDKAIRQEKMIDLLKTSRVRFELTTPS